MSYKRIVLAITFVATVYAANWTLERYGLIPVTMDSLRRARSDRERGAS